MRNRKTGLPGFSLLHHEGRVGVLHGIYAGNISTKPVCVDGDGWSDSSSLSTNLSGDALGMFPGVSVASQGQPWHRLTDTQVLNVRDGMSYRFKVFWGVGTSGEMRCNFRNNQAGQDTFVFGSFGGLSVIASNAGTFSDLSEYEISGVKVFEGIFTPNADYDLQVGIGPNSSTSGETVIAYGFYLENTPVDWLGGIDSDNLLSLPKCVDGDGWTDSGSSSTNRDDNALGFFPGVTVASGGQVFHRLIDIQAISLTSGTDYSIRVFCAPGTSGAVRVLLINPETGDSTRISGPFGSIAAGFAGAGAITGVTEVTQDGVTIVDAVFTPNASFDLQFGIGPDSATLGETVIAYGAIIREA